MVERRLKFPIYSPELQVKQFVSSIQNNSGIKFIVFKTGNEKYYLFCPIKDGIMSTLQIPIAKKDLRNNIRKMLNNGYGNCII